MILYKAGMKIPETKVFRKPEVFFNVARLN